MANVRIIVLSQFNAFAAKQNFGQHIINHAGQRKLLRVNETRNFSHANRTQTSLCSASYVNRQRGAAHIRLSHAAAAARLLLTVKQPVDISCPPGPQQQTRRRCRAG